jgi:hypothetical protein
MDASLENGGTMIGKINLQLFADDELEEELDDIELEADEEEAEPEVDEPETEDEPEAEPEKPKKDKVTAAIIREKQAKKALRDKLAAYEKDKADREQAERYSQQKQKLIDNGFTEEEAEDRIADRKEREELKRELKSIKYGQQADKLVSKYPDIHEHLDSFIGIIEASKGAITLAELCKAKLDESTTADIRTRAEQEVLLTKKKAKEKQTEPGETKGSGVIKFSPADEEAYKFYASKNPGKTRKDYNEILKIRRGE